MKKNILLAVLSLFLYTSSIAQRCGTNHRRTQHIKENPAIQNKINEIESFTQQWSINYNNSHNKTTALVTLPVVVHVLYTNTTQNISMSQIKSQIRVLNEDFRKANSNFSSTPAPFQAVAADVEIEFCLASLDPNNNPTSGVTRTATTVADIGNTENWYKSANGGHDAWDAKRYINIWVCEIDGGSTLGFATPPGASSGPDDDGIVIDYRFLGTTGTAASSAPNHLGRTATHEMGHYLNLEHVWGMNGGCGDDDFVQDTPNQEYDNSGCPTFPAFDNCTSSGNGTMFSNYMDYTDDACMSMFTQGQKVRMLAALNGPRADLLNSNLCGTAVSVNDKVKSTPQIKVYPNPSSGMITIETGALGQFNGQVFDITGSQIKSFTLRQKEILNLSELPAGVYYVSLSAKNRERISKKIVITK